MAHHWCHPEPACNLISRATASSVLAYVAVGWVGIVTIPQMFSGVGVRGSVLVMVGGALYTLGALVYAFHWPNPFPATFGFHEIFHLLVVAAATTQFIAVSLVVV